MYRWKYDHSIESIEYDIVLYFQIICTTSIGCIVQYQKWILVLIKFRSTVWLFFMGSLFMVQFFIFRHSILRQSRDTWKLIHIIFTLEHVEKIHSSLCNHMKLTYAYLNALIYFTRLRHFYTIESFTSATDTSVMNADMLITA